MRCIGKENGQIASLHYRFKSRRPRIVFKKAIIVVTYDYGMSVRSSKLF